MRKVISLFLVCVMMLSMVQISYATELDGSTLWIDSTIGEAKADYTVSDTIQVPVYMDKVPEVPTGFGYYALGVVFTYDKTKLRFIGPVSNGKQVYDVNYPEDAGRLSWGYSVTGDKEIDEKMIQSRIQATPDLNNAKQYVTATHFTPNSVLVYLEFERLANQKGKSELKIDQVIFTGATIENQEGQYKITSSNLDYSTDTDHSTISNATCMVKFTDAYAATVGTNGQVEQDDPETTEIVEMVDGATVAIKAEKDGVLLNEKELDGDLTETVTVTISDVVRGYKAVPTATGATLVDGTVDPDDGSGTYTFKMPANDVDVDVTYEKRTYNITYPTTEAVVSWSPASAEFGETVTINPTYTNGKYSLVGVKANDGAVELTDNGNKTYSFTMPADDVEITIEDFDFAADNFDVNATLTADAYKITNLDTSYAERTPVTFTVTNNEGYKVNEVTATGVELTDNGDGTYSFVMPDNAVTIIVDATAIERTITDSEGNINNELITVSALTSVGHTVDFITKSASVGQTVQFKITPAENKSITGVTAKFTNGSVECTLVNSILFELGGVYSFTMPADGKVELTATEVSADVSLQSISVIGGSSDPITVDGSESYDVELHEYYDGTVIVSATATDTTDVVVDPADPTAIVGGNTKKFAITVYSKDYDHDANDGAGYGTKATYYVNVKNPFQAGAANLILADSVDSVTKGSRYTATVKATGIPAGSTWVDFKIQLPEDIILLDDEPVHFELGTGVTAPDATTEILYDDATGIVTAKILNGTTEFAAGEIELLTMTFDIVEETDVTLFDVAGLSANYSQDQSANVVSFVSYGLIDDVPITETNATIADVKKAIVNGLYKEENYTEQDWFLVEDAIETALAAIDAAADAAEMDAAIDALKLTVEGGTDPADGITEIAPIETLAAYKDKLVKEIQDYATALIDSEAYFEAEEEAIQAIADKYNTVETGLIDANTSRDEELLALLVDDAKAKMLAIETKAAIKADALEEIVVDNTLYVDEAQAAITTAINNATTAINNAESEAVVNQAVADFNTAIGKLEAQKIVTERNASIGEVAGGKTIEDVDYEGVNDLDEAAYTSTNWNKILIEQLKATIAIGDTTSSKAMDAAVEEALKNIDAIKTIAEEENDALAEINEAESAADLNIDLIEATGVDNVEKSKEALYEAAILEYLKVNPSGFADVKALQAEINRVNGLTIGKRGDFNNNGTVDGSDAAGAMKYLCGVALGWVPTAQGIVNADLCTPGDGVLTVYDVVQIIKEINL